MAPMFTVTYIELTPEKARELLQWNEGNRSLRQSKIDQLAATMAAGEWDVLADPGLVMALLPDGTRRLLNGQHRLHAVITSGALLRGVQLRTVEATAEEAMVHYAKFDQGANRNVPDVLGDIEGAVGRDVGVVATALALIDVLLPGGHRKLRMLTVAERAAIFRAKPLDAEFGLMLRRDMRVGGKQIPTGMVMAGIEMFRVAPDHAKEFWKQVSEGVLLLNTDPTFLLRELLIAGGTRRSGGSGTTLVLRQRVQALTAWRAFCRGEKLGRLMVKINTPEEYMAFLVAKPKGK